MARELSHLTNVGIELNVTRSDNIVALKALSELTSPLTQPSLNVPRQYSKNLEQQSGLQLNSRLFQRTLDSTLLYKYVMLLFT